MNKLSIFLYIYLFSSIYYVAAGQKVEHLLEMVARLEAEGAELKEKIARLEAESKEKIARLEAEGSESKEKIARFEAESCNNKELNQFIRPVVLIPI